MTWLNFERALIEFGDLILVILGAALTLGMKLAMPFMLAGIVDKHIASKTTYPFFYGVDRSDAGVAFGIEDHRIVAYMWGNVAMAVGDSSPLYIWNYETMRAITDPLGAAAVHDSVRSLRDGPWRALSLRNTVHLAVLFIRTHL